MAKNIKNIMKMYDEFAVEFVDFRFTDTKGRWHHMTQHVSTVDEDLLTNGIMFDGSSISGWKTIDDSDMLLIPDLDSAIMDPFSYKPQLVLICNVVEPSTGQGYERDPRSIAKRALAYMGKQGVGDTAYFGPEAEFFMFDDVRWSTEPHSTGFVVDDEELHVNSATEYSDGNDGYHVKKKGGYIPTLPLDKAVEIRAEMVTTGLEFGIPMEKHHHEVASAQHELGVKFLTLVECADNMQKYKHVVQNVAQQFGKTATFMPKPVYGDNGSGMHVHQSIWKDGENIFAGNGYADLSDTCLYYIGGIIKHAKAINAFTNPSTNSYKRLVPGFEAPVLLAYSASNRSASCRIPHASSPKAKRVEVRFPDPMANPYLAYTALLMAGLDGIKNKIHPGEAMDKDLYELPADKLKSIPTVCGSLREALESLDANRGFLTEGGVFTDNFIDSYLALKWEEVYTLEQTPHPVEFEMYYDC
jgi:glutamine synthetase